MDMNFTLIHRSKVIVSVYKNWINSSDKVLDIGCGNGIITKELKKHFDCKITGTDIVNYLKVSIPFEIMKNENKIPFEDNTFNIALLNDVLHHTKYQEEMIKEATRVADSVLIFEVSPSLKVKIADYLINKIHNAKMKTPFNFRNLNDWKLLFEKLGIKCKYIRIRKASLTYPFTTYAFYLQK